MTKANWMRYAVMLFCCLMSHLVRADVVLVGNMNIGDNSTNAIEPTALVGQSNSIYTPGTHPIHFSLSQSGVVTQLKINNLSGYLHGVNFVVWNSSGQVVISQTATDTQPSQITGSWSLAAGDYRMAVWGQCIKKNSYDVISYSSCLNTNGQQEWDDISFTNITLTGVHSSTINFIQRLHIGDNTDATRWYPPSPSSNVSVSDAVSGAAINSNSTGASVTYSFAVASTSKLSKLTLFKMSDWQIADASRIQLRQKNSSTYLWQYSFTANGDLSWQPNLILYPGNYEVVVSVDYSYWYDSDDIDWDGVVITTEPYTLTYQCSEVFPYPLQGRSNTDYVNLASNEYGYLAARIWGTQGGKLGYQSSSQILHPGSTSNGNTIVDGNCDNKLCSADKLAGAISLPSTPFPLVSGASFTLYYNQSRTLTAADGYNFGTITTNYQSSLNFTVSGITIKNLFIGSDLPGKAYTVKFAAGEYWIENLTMGDSASIVLDGNVILHVKNMNMESANLVNSDGVNKGGAVSKLLLVIYDSLYLGNGSTLSGLIYQSDSAASAITLSSASYIYGRINAHNVQFGNGSVVNSSSYNCSGTSSVIHHYEIRYPSSQIACEPATITVNACTNSDTSSCMKDTTASSSIALSAPISGWSSNPVTLTNGTGTVSLSHYTAENVKLGLSGSAYACFKNGVLDSTCELPFVSSALSFDIPTFTAGGNSDNVTLKAIKSDGTGVCSALLSGSQPISFTNSYVTPTTVADLPQIINSSTSTATSISSNTSVVLTFNGNGVATFKLAYNNAGVLNLAAQYTKANTDTGVGTLTISGSDTVAVIPAAIRVEPADSAAICANTTHASCTKYKTVGDNFTLNAEAGYGNGATWKKTSNFFTNQMSSLPVLQHQLLAPASGTLPSLTTTTLSFSGGTATTSISENDVGVYQYGVTDFVPYPDYQNESPKKMVPISWSDAIGRFVPAKLKTTLLSHGAFTSENCKANAVLTSLAYVGQELQFAALPMFSVVATDSNGNALQNYRDDFAKITTANPTATSTGVFTPSLVSKDNTTLIAAATWKAGSWLSAGNSHTYSFGDDRFIFTKSANHVNPFTTVLTLSALADSDGVVAISSVSPFYFYPWAANNSSAFNVYDGRLMLNSVNGAENAALTLPFYMQYWNGSAYALNTADHCSSLNATDLQMNDAANWSGINLRTSNSSSASATTNASLFPAVVAQGAGAILFTAPNNTGWVDISASSSLPLWMQDLSLSSGLAPARASFGYYRGNDRLIYRREVFGGQ